MRTVSSGPMATATVRQPNARQYRHVIDTEEQQYHIRENEAASARAAVLVEATAQRRGDPTGRALSRVPMRGRQCDFDSPR